MNSLIMPGACLILGICSTFFNAFPAHSTVLIIYMTSDPSFSGDILIVDDTPDNLRLLTAMLSEQGYEVRSVTDGATALMGIHAQPPDLILLDITMPSMNGYEVCERLKANPDTRSIPVIFISALNETIDKVKAFTIGGCDYITKPFQVEEVLARIENQLTIRRLNQRVEQLATLEERNRIARDIHDSLGHALVALNIQLQTTLSLWEKNPQKAYEFLVEAKQLGSEALKAVRESVTDLRSQPLQGQLLEGAIATLMDEFYATTGISPTIDLQLAHPTSHSLNTVLYRIVQEGLTNICKYAEATAVHLHIEAIASGVSLSLQDNGRGFRVDEHRTGFGLKGMQERTLAQRGQLHIASEPGKGCRITAYFPL
jgi:two-component system sensor histidine kinase/response regulator